MEYLNDIGDNLKTIDEEDIVYYDLFDFPELFYGNLNFTSDKLNFSKFSDEILNDMEKYGENIHNGIAYYNNSSCGNRLRFSTSSRKIIFKVQLKRKWPFQKVINWNAMGFDVYSINDNGEYIFKSIFAPMDGFNTFAEIINFPPNTKLCIFLPSYNIIEKIYLGIEKNCTFSNVDYPKDKQLPIIFYGNSITQGAAASRSGNAFPNILSKKLNRDIINLSSSAGCLGTPHIAELIGKINCHSIVIDYTKNAPTLNVFSKTYESFYDKIREFHPNKKIILLTSEHFNEWDKSKYEKFDEIVINTYKKAVKNGENTFLVNQRQLFNKNEWDYVVIDAGHYTDYGMFRVAKELYNIIND